jgi:hypothetical protein
MAFAAILIPISGSLGDGSEFFNISHANAYINHRGVYLLWAKQYGYAEGHQPKMTASMISHKHKTHKKEDKEHMADSRNPGDINQNRDIIKEVANINQQAQNAYQKTTNWHQQPADAQVPGQADQLKQIIQRIDRIEEKIDNLGKMLK